MDLFLLAAAVLIIVLCITLVFIRRATKTGEAAKPKEKKRKKVKKEKEIDEKLDKITGGGEEVKGPEDRETAKGEGEKLDEETLNLGKELVEEGVMDKYMIEGDLEGIDDMYLESGGKEDFDFEGLGDKKSITAEGPNDDLFTELKKLSTFERRDEFNIMRGYKKKKFDLANLRNELTGAVDKLERDKKQGKIRVRRKRRRI
ncbi:MAG: hypothetical protein EF807_02200 [Candidatus Methanolliviera hydrocarbonicum]|uniref:Uncharacterized protein n=1 Tax=Candidatus Methanolliviera hydrocarbonicum TaxID=2491085 RepID=A0A520KVA2_9EURY|nr:MAG: hypothetical protein EF807_07835 [Candidatus Methanolliviera hydrocarbonicum]RZN71683.1 MAG: hypothetical protein EF807_02200 [Candidatus Methanolliviera hydrocarbonicum]